MTLPGAYTPPSPFPNPVPPPTLGEGTVCLSIDAGWLPYLLGAAKALRNNSVWRSTDPAVVAGITSSANELLDQLAAAGACPMLEFRVNPENPCLIDASIDGGTTWVTLPNTSACAVILDPLTNTRNVIEPPDDIQGLTIIATGVARALSAQSHGMVAEFGYTGSAPTADPVIKLQTGLGGGPALDSVGDGIVVHTVDGHAQLNTRTYAAFGDAPAPTVGTFMIVDDGTTGTIYGGVDIGGTPTWAPIAFVASGGVFIEKAPAVNNTNTITGATGDDNPPLTINADKQGLAVNASPDNTQGHIIIFTATASTENGHTLLNKDFDDRAGFLDVQSPSVFTNVITGRGNLRNGANPEPVTPADGFEGYGFTVAWNDSEEVSRLYFADYDYPTGEYIWREVWPGATYRVSPTDPTTIQQSLNHGMSWSDWFTAGGSAPLLPTYWRNSPTDPQTLQFAADGVTFSDTDYSAPVGISSLPVLPPSGGEVEFDLLVNARGTYLPFFVPTGYQFAVVGADGYWNCFDATAGESITDFRGTAAFVNDAINVGAMIMLLETVDANLIQNSAVGPVPATLSAIPSQPSLIRLYANPFTTETAPPAGLLYAHCVLRGDTAPWSHDDDLTVGTGQIPFSIWSSFALINAFMPFAGLEVYPACSAASDDYGTYLAGFLGSSVEACSVACGGAGFTYMRQIGIYIDLGAAYDLVAGFFTVEVSSADASLSHYSIYGGNDLTTPGTSAGSGDHLGNGTITLSFSTSGSYRYISLWAYFGSCVGYPSFEVTAFHIEGTGTDPYL